MNGPGFAQIVGSDNKYRVHRMNDWFTSYSSTVLPGLFTSDQNRKCSQGKSVVDLVVNDTIFIVNEHVFDYSLESDIDNGYKYKDWLTCLPNILLQLIIIGMSFYLMSWEQMNI